MVGWLERGTTNQAASPAAAAGGREGGRETARRRYEQRRSDHIRRGYYINMHHCKLHSREGEGLGAVYLQIRNKKNKA